MSAKGEILRLLGEIERAANYLAHDARTLAGLAEGLDEECDTFDCGRMARLARSVDRANLSSLIVQLERAMTDRDEEEEEEAEREAIEAAAAHGGTTRKSGRRCDHDHVLGSVRGVRPCGVHAQRHLSARHVGVLRLLHRLSRQRGEVQ
jgi:hypothetical protein